MNHKRAAFAKDAIYLEQVLPCHFERVEMLKDMAGEYAGNGAVEHWQIRATVATELDIFGGHLLPRVFNHVFGDVKRMHDAKVFGHRASHASGTATDLDATIAIQPIQGP